MSQLITPINGTPDSFLILNVIQDPKSVMEHIDTLLTPDANTPKSEYANSKPRVSFYSEYYPDTNSLAYLRCPSIQTVEEYTPLLRTISNTVDPATNIIKVLKYDNGSKALKAHADKTIDLDDKVPIYTIRLGSPRKFVLTHKTNGTIIETSVPHNAMFVLGLKTNAEFTHGVPADPNTTNPTYSIILRKSVTFKDVDSNFLWGPRTRFPSYTSLKDYVKFGAKIDDNKNELITLWGLENKYVVGPTHYTNYCSTVASVSLDRS